MSQEKSMSFPPITWEEQSEQVIKVDEATPSPKSAANWKQEKIDRLIAVIRKEHAHIGKYLEIMWGQPECQKYLTELIYGGDNMNLQQNIRVGFKPEVFQALISLEELQ